LARSTYRFPVRLDSIRSRILALAILGTLVPTSISLGVAYNQHRRALQAQVTQNLLSASSGAARAAGVWLKERLYDLRVFATSDEVGTNVNRYAIGQGSIPSARLREYLRSLQQKFPDFEQLVVTDGQGRVIASGSAQASQVTLPGDWQKVMRQGNQLVGDASWDEKAGKGKLLVAVPVTRADGEIIGAFAAEIALAPVQTLLKQFSTDGEMLYLTSERGALMATSGEMSEASLNRGLSGPTFDVLLAEEHAAVSYRNVSGVDVIGTLDRVPQLEWSVIAELPTAEAFDTVRSFRNIALLVFTVLLVVIGWVAFRLGLVIVRPLERLAAGANVVSTGDLEVDLPTTGEAGEVDALTTVFNNMVRRLRAGRQQLASLNEALRAHAESLEKLSVTDGLTGLVNHRALMQRLGEETIRAKRTERPFCVVMVDVDYFKKYNDEFGHPAGDEVLKQVAQILKDSTRTVDCVARYGGEEFSALLPETSVDGAMEVAERMRVKVESAQFAGSAVTVSIGVAEFPTDAPTAEKIIAVADRALYDAKKLGRNRVVRGRAVGRKTRAMLAVKTKPVSAAASKAAPARPTKKKPKA
jgi:diguanylate cyclase (GGDEF)-like protein